MSTRSTIGKLIQGRVRYIYCQYDGYLKAVGDTLLNSYADEEHLDKLIDLDNISRLGNHPVSFPFMWDFFHPLALSEELTRAYKDRGKKTLKAKWPKAWMASSQNLKKSLSIAIPMARAKKVRAIVRFQMGISNRSPKTK